MGKEKRTQELKELREGRGFEPVGITYFLRGFFDEDDEAPETRAAASDIAADSWPRFLASSAFFSSRQMLPTSKNFMFSWMSSISLTWDLSTFAAAMIALRSSPSLHASDKMPHMRVRACVFSGYWVMSSRTGATRARLLSL